jgi:hypothetical protein
LNPKGGNGHGIGFDAKGHVRPDEEGINKVIKGRKAHVDPTGQGGKGRREMNGMALSPQGFGDIKGSQGTAGSPTFRGKDEVSFSSFLFRGLLFHDLGENCIRTMHQATFTNKPSPPIPVLEDNLQGFNKPFHREGAEKSKNDQDLLNSILL